jgi:hypothetical protein
MGSATGSGELALAGSPMSRNCNDSGHSGLRQFDFDPQIDFGED